MIRRIAIDNYRCFTNFEFEPGRVNLLLGPNGSGKSSFFDAMVGLVDLTRYGADVADVFPTRSLCRWDRRDRQRFELDVEGEAGRYSYILVIHHDRENARPVIETERISFEGKTLYLFENGTVHLNGEKAGGKKSFPYKGNRSFLAQVEARGETRELSWLLRFFYRFQAVRLDARRVGSNSDGEQQALAQDGTNFASWYRHFSQEHPEHLQNLWATLRGVIPGFNVLKLVGAGGDWRSRRLVAVMNVSGVSHDIDFDELSDGQRALVVLYTLLQGIEPQEGCLMLDEPEAHVGIAEVQPWLVELDERYMDVGQVFVASQHPEVVDYLAAGEPFLFERPDAGPARVRRAMFDRECGMTASAQLARGLDDAE